MKFVNKYIYLQVLLSKLISIIIYKISLYKEVGTVVKARFDTKLFSQLKDILLRKHDNDEAKKTEADFMRYFKDVPITETLLIAHELKSGDTGITSEHIKRLFTLYKRTSGRGVEDLYKSKLQEDGHPVQIFYEENRALLSIVDRVSELMETLADKSPQKIERLFEPLDNTLVIDKENPIQQLNSDMLQLGQFINHFHRKEKLFFPILERYGHFTLARTMWADDDQIRNLFKGTKSMIERLPQLPFEYIKKSYDLFEQKFRDMIFQEEAFLLPVICHYFTDEDWIAIAKESEAFGFAVIKPNEKWLKEHAVTPVETKPINEITNIETTPIPFGGGFLTIKEANSILNNLPVEITFVDKFAVFKYFNEKVKSSEMMFVRTSTSVGRNVGHCHPPRSMKKVAQLISDLKNKRRKEETMWFKKGGRYIHITYKALFAEDGEYLGVLEYVQDIQPFLELPREVKKEITPLEGESEAEKE